MDSNVPDALQNGLLTTDNRAEVTQELGMIVSHLSDICNCLNVILRLFFWCSVTIDDYVDT